MIIPSLHRMSDVHVRNHWLVRVKDGKNFKNSKHPCWGVRKGAVPKKLKPGDILWFLTSKPYGGKIIGMAEYTGCYSRLDEPLIPVHTYSNDEMGWVGGGDWDIQLNYTNLYDTTRQSITAIVCCAGNILNYNTFKDRGLPNLPMHYENFKYYAEPVRVE